MAACQVLRLEDQPDLFLAIYAKFDLSSYKRASSMIAPESPVATVISQLRCICVSNRREDESLTEAGSLPTPLLYKSLVFDSRFSLREFSISLTSSL